MAYFLADGNEIDNIKDMECCHGELDFPAPSGEGACGSTDFDLVYGDKGVIEVTCKKCGTKYRLTPSMHDVVEIKPKRQTSKTKEGEILIARYRYVRDDILSGENQPSASLTNHKATIIRWSSALSRKPGHELIARRYQIHYNTLYRILKGWTYRVANGPTMEKARQSPLIVSLADLSNDERYEIFENICPKCWPQNHLKKIDCKMTDCRIADPKICKRIFLGGMTIAIQ